MSLLGRLFPSEASRWGELREKLLAARIRSDRNVSQLGQPLRSADREPEDALASGVSTFRELRRRLPYAGAVIALASELGLRLPLPWPLSADRLLWLHLADRFDVGPHLSSCYFDMALTNIAAVMRCDLGFKESVLQQNLEHEGSGYGESIDPFDHFLALHRVLTDRGARAEFGEHHTWIFTNDGDRLCLRAYPERVLLFVFFVLSEGVRTNPSRIAPLADRLNEQLFCKLRFAIDRSVATIEYVVPRQLAASRPEEVLDDWRAESRRITEVAAEMRALLL